jgi:pilus assembly protein CpaF
VGNVHALLEQTKDGIFVEHHEGGATLVNGEKVKRYGPLRASDVIGVGAYHISVGWAQPEGEDTEEPDAEFFTTMIGVRPHAEIKSDDSIFREERFRWRNQVHQELLHQMDLRRTDVGSMDEKKLRRYMEELIAEAIYGMRDRLPPHLDQQRLAKEVLDEAVGLGPLEDLIAADDVTEIMVNKFDDIYVERKGKLTKSEVTFSSDDAVMSAIERIVSPIGRRIDESSPMVDARLKNGSRVNAIIPPLALRGPCITIRKFSTKRLTAQDLLGFDAVSREMMAFLKVAVEQKRNIIVSGGTGSGKTTFLNVLSNYIPMDERIITVEDAAELKLVQPHLVALEARPPNLEGKGAIPIRDLVKNCLRMRPDRIVVGECRGGETLDMLQAMNTGHDGSLTTAHANSPRDLIARLEVMVMMAGMDLPARAIREQVASAVDIVVQQSRFSDGSRKNTYINEITGVENGVVQMQEIFRFQQQGFDAQGRVKGYFYATGRVPEFYEDLRARGIPVDMSLFAKRDRP